MRHLLSPKFAHPTICSSWLGLRLGLLLLVSLTTIVFALGVPMFAVQARSLTLARYQNAPVMDVQQFKFADLPVFSRSGKLQVPPALVAQLGFDPSVIWQAGDPPAQILKLGTFEQVFGLENFNLQTIGQLVNQPLASLSLENFELMSWQSVRSLVEAIPSLANQPIAQVPPIADLVRQYSEEYFLNLEQSASKVVDLLQSAPKLAQESLGKWLDLRHYGLTSIPGLEQTPLRAFHLAGNSTIAGVPGLDRVLGKQFPQPLQIPTNAIVARVDIPLHTREGDRGNTRPISGGDQVGFNIPCPDRCSHLETATGEQWFAGDAQQVKGGYGLLSSLFNGLEPTGRLPYGPGFKVVVSDVDETSGQVATQLYFRFCLRTAWADFGCTPYAIGPVPFLVYREADWIFLGAATPGTPSSAYSIPVGSTAIVPEVRPASSMPTSISTSALSPIQRFAATTGLAPNQVETLAARARQQTDPFTGLAFVGDRQWQRVAQMHFGGENLPIDAPATTTQGISVADYSRTIQP